MKTYIAGTVLRPCLKPPVYERLERLYRSIEITANQNGHTAELSYPDHYLDRMELNDFQREIRRRIEEADSVIAILDPPNEAVAIEAHFAAEIGKPQAILVENVAQPPQAIRGLERYALHATDEPSLDKIFEELAKAVMQRRTVRRAGLA
jgi:nucleoside 2-deoxyribosyltransferase